MSQTFSPSLSQLTSRGFWIATLERMIRTFAQVLVATLGLESVGVVNANWGDGLSLAAGAAVATLLTAVATSGVGGAGPGITEHPDAAAAAAARAKPVGPAEPTG